MVVIKLWIEGGVLPPLNNPLHGRDDSMWKTIDNTNSLRQSFKKLFSKVFPDESNIRFIPEMGSGRDQTANFFKDDFLQYNTLMLRDLDAPKIEREETISKISNKLEMPVSEIEGKVFFMVQEMEAWILSQPYVIERVFADHKVGKFSIENDDQIFDKNIETIIKPSKVIEIILQRYFVIEKAGKKKKLKYGKLKHSPDLIENLDIHKLKNTFEDVGLLINKINKLSLIK